MNWFSMLALCASTNTPASIDCAAVLAEYNKELARLELTKTDIDAITRTAYAEAANQGALGLSGVVFTILNRKISGKFSDSIENIVNAKNQFEPVTTVGHWQYLPEPTSAQVASIETIVDLAQSGYLADPTHGALYFQNSEVVADRVEKGTISPNMVHFGDSPVLATIDDHTFYALMCQTPKSNNKSRPKKSALRKWEGSAPAAVKQLRGGNASNQ